MIETEERLHASEPVGTGRGSQGTAGRIRSARLVGPSLGTLRGNAEAFALFQSVKVICISATLAEFEGATGARGFVEIIPDDGALRDIAVDSRILGLIADVFRSGATKLLAIVGDTLIIVGTRIFG